MDPSEAAGPLLDGIAKAIAVVSPQPWDGLPVSKHHYATEVAGLGHKVYFVEPPLIDGRRRGGISIVPTETIGVMRVVYAPFFPYALKFRSRWLFDRLMQRQAKSIVRALQVHLDIVWDFDNSYQFAELTGFGADWRIFHPVDALTAGRRGDKGADLLLSVSQTFLDGFPHRRGHVIDHALSREHERVAEAVAEKPERCQRAGQRPVVGYVGNLEHVGVDWPTIVRIAEANRDTMFRFIGPSSWKGSERNASIVPRQQLLQLGNCEFLGRLPARHILDMAPEIDIWLVCYDSRKSIDGGLNSHKILEYLATGQAVLANRIQAYIDNPLIEMSRSPTNDDMPGLLKRMLERREEINAPSARRARAELALQHTYAANIKMIDALLAGVVRHKRT